MASYLKRSYGPLPYEELLSVVERSSMVCCLLCEKLFAFHLERVTGLLPWENLWSVTLWGTIAGYLERGYGLPWEALTCYHQKRWPNSGNSAWPSALANTREKSTGLLLTLRETLAYYLERSPAYFLLREALSITLGEALFHYLERSTGLLTPEKNWSVTLWEALVYYLGRSLACQL